MRRDPIVIVDHDPHWAASFEEQRVVLEPALDGVLVRPLEHIGSTAVPGLPAKPIVDLLGVVANYEAALAALPRLAEVGWVHAPEPDDDARRTVSACHPEVAHRTHHLHLVEETSTGWPDWLLFRDHLRTHPDVAAAYAVLKRSLAAADPADPDDRQRYRSAKAPFIVEVLEAARAAR